MSVITAIFETNFILF